MIPTMTLLLIAALTLAVICGALLADRVHIKHQRDNALCRGAEARQEVGEWQRKHSKLLAENTQQGVEIVQLRQLNAQLMARNDYWYAAEEEAA